MKSIGQKFRLACNDYFNDSTLAENQKKLIKVSLELFKDSSRQGKLGADDFMVSIDNIVKQASHGLYVDDDKIKEFDNFIHGITLSDMTDNYPAFHALNLLLNIYLKQFKKNCLKDIVHNFLLTQEKLEYEISFLSKIEQSKSIFLSYSDISKLNTKKTMIDELLNIAHQQTLEQCNSPTTESQEDSSLLQLIDSLTEDKCHQVLTKVLEQMFPILNQCSNPELYLNQRSALKAHSFDDRWFFAWLSILVQRISCALGLKTETEELFEQCHQYHSILKI